MGSSATTVAMSRPIIGRAAPPTSTDRSFTMPPKGARTTPRSSSASAAACAASAARNCASRLTNSSFGQFPVRISLRLASSSVRRWISSDSACATCARRASSESTAMMSPFSTRDPRRTRNSVSTPPERAATVTRLSASVRPESTSLRACSTTWAGKTATRNGFLAAPSLRSAALLAAVSCGRKCPDAIQSTAAATRPTAVMRLPFIGSPPCRVRPSGGRAACGG